MTKFCRAEKGCGNVFVCIETIGKRELRVNITKSTNNACFNGNQIFGKGKLS